ncbi:MAG: PAS domain-containing protein, partial [Deltaproteobacteria bacterium]|nr:PAS domain-containing protein [Deltaproteobacteria bacterium]
RIIDANQAFLDQYHPSKTYVIGQTCHQVTHHLSEPCVPPLDPCPLLETVKTGQPSSAEHVHFEKGGKRVFAEITTFPMYDESGQITSVVHISRDITQRKQAEEERKGLIKQLEEAQTELKQLFDEVPCYISVQDRDLRLTAINRAFKEDFGDEIGAHCYEIYKHRTDPCFDCPVERTFAEGAPQTSEEIVTSKKGQQYHVLVSTAPIRDAEGEITQVMELSTNITQIRELQDNLASMGLLLGSMSHGIKGLLTGLDGGMYKLDSGFAKDNPERIKEGWGVVKLMVGRIRSMVLDLLYYAKERELNWEKVDVLTLAEDVALTIDPMTRDHDIEFVRDFDPSVGEFEVDPGVVRSALTNILENSIDACLEDKLKNEHRIVFRVAQDADNVIFEVSDNGSGMDQQTRENMFTLFFSSKGSRGTGLGLFISNQVIQQHGGSIEVESSLGEGSRFYIQMPKRLPEEAKTS